MSTTLLAATCGAAIGDCGQPSTIGNQATASDALRILQTAVGAKECTEFALPCICDVTGDNSVTASDALVTLRLAVGQPVTLHCPSCPSNDASAAILRSRRLLVLQQVQPANREFSCALEAAPNDPEANAFYAVTRLLTFLAANEELQSVLAAANLQGNLDIYHFHLSSPVGFVLPQSTDVSPLLLGALDAELAGSLDNLSKAMAAGDFSTILPPAVLGESNGASGRSIEIDKGDLLAFSSFLHLIRFQLLFTIGSYSDETIDQLGAGLNPSATPNCGRAVIQEHPRFFTTKVLTRLGDAKAELSGALSDARDALLSIRNEVDNQDDDLLVVGNAALGADLDTFTALLASLKASLDEPTSVPACDGTPALLFLGALFDTPLDRHLMDFAPPSPPQTGPACGDNFCNFPEEDELSCSGDCGCAALTASICTSVAVGGCGCSEDCVRFDDCCTDACSVCGFCRCSDFLSDPTLNGLFPGITTVDGLQGLLAGGYPLCNGVPPQWTCDSDFFGTDDGCDCGCGALDPDCPDAMVGSCQFCNDFGSCATSCVDIAPDNSAACIDGGTQTQ